MILKCIIEFLSPVELQEILWYVDRTTAKVSRWRSCKIKCSYEAYEIALREGRKYHGEQAKVYHCKFCQNFHITTSSLRRGERERTKNIVKSRKKRKNKEMRKLKKPWWWEKRNNLSKG